MSSFMETYFCECAKPERYVRLEGKQKAKSVRRSNSVLRVMFRAKKMQRHIRLIDDHPAIVTRADVKQIAGPHLVVASVFHLAGGVTGHNHADMFHFA